MSVHSPTESDVPEASPQAPVERPRARRLNSGTTGLLIGIVTFVALYSWMLIATDFLPYVTDNNESFSSLWHAYNLYHFDIRESAGLTDETFSPHPEAHPFVHTHQGNVPRLFAFVLYVLGARTIEAQIGLTTLIVGTATVAIAYRLFSRLAGALFATIACLTLVTDYLFFGQWAVVTYRIWHFFFVFSALAAACEIGGRRVRTWAALTVVLFALLFYYELVFAGFTAVFAGLFAGWRYRWRPKRLALTWAAQVIGSMIGIAVLAAQLTAHLGGAVALEDFRLTFIARNAVASDPTLRQYMTEFFLSHGIIYWQNSVDTRTFRTLEQFALLLTTQHLQWYTPLVALLTAMLLIGWVAGTVGDALTGWWKRRHAAAAAESSRQGMTELVRGLITLVTLLLPTMYLALTILRDEAYLGRPITGASFGQRTGGLGWVMVAAVVAIVALAAWNGSHEWRQLLRAVARVSMVRVVLTVALLVGMSLAIREQSYLYLESYTPIWHVLMQQPVPLAVSRAATAVVLGLAAALVLAGPRRVLGEEQARQLQGIWPYLICGAVAYTAVYVISPGYVYSGYLSRFAPLAVFILNVPVAAALCLLLMATMRAVQSVRVYQTPAALAAGQHPFVPCLRAGLLTGGLVFFVGFWLHAQLVMVSIWPPNSVSFLKLLGEPPLKGLSLASNFYVAPTTIYTGEWGYLDSSLALGKVEATDLGYVVERGDGSYMWLRDRLTNPDYLEPDLFVCMRPPGIFTLLQAVTGQSDEIEGCGSLPLVAQAASGAQPYLQHQVVARDPSPMDAWAILRLDWDYPPYLYPLPGGNQRRLVDVDRVEEGDRLKLNIRYLYRQQKGIPESGTVVSLEGVRRDGMVCTLMEQTGVDSLSPPSNIRGRVQVVVTPATATKRGPRYESARFTIGGSSDVDACRGKTVRPG